MNVRIRTTAKGTLVGVEAEFSPEWLTAAEARILADNLVLAAREAEAQDAGCAEAAA